MSDIETLQARVRELEMMLRTAIDENRTLEAQSREAQAHMRRLRHYLRPEVAGEAIHNVRSQFGRCGVVPAYKVDETTDLALQALGGKS